MRTLIASLILVLVALTGCQTQTTTAPASTEKKAAPPTEKTKEEQEKLDWIARHGEEAKALFPKYQIKPVSASLPAAGNELGWNENLALSLKYWQDEPKHYGTEEDFFGGIGHEIKSFDQADHARELYQAYRVQVITAYGLLGYGNSPVYPREIHSSVSTIFTNGILREVAYRWAMPSVKIAFRGMPKVDRDTYLEILMEANSYLESFDQARETAYFTSLADNGCKTEAWQKKYFKLPAGWLTNPETRDTYYGRCESLFSQLSPDGTDNPYRKAEIFIYRRIAQDHWNRGTMKAILDRVITDLRPLL